MPPHDDDEDEEGDTAAKPKKQPAVVERVTAHSYGALTNVPLSQHDCWMIRIPPKLAELWESAPEGTDLGQLVFRKGGAGKQYEKGSGTSAMIKPTLMVHVAEQLVQTHKEELFQRETADAVKLTKLAATANTGPTALKLKNSLLKPGTAANYVVPMNYSLAAMTKKIPTMHPFIRNSRNGSVQIIGNVSRTANLQVEQDSNYRALLKNRLVQTNVTSSRFVKPVEATESVMAKSKNSASNTTVPGQNATKKTFGNAVYQFGKRMMEAAESSKTNFLLQAAGIQGSAGGAGNGSGGGPNAKKARQFAPDQPIRSVIFELFGQQQYWTVKDLKAAAVAGGATNASTKKAEAEMRDVLREIGEYHRSGDHKNMWELKKEFQHTK